METVRVDLAYRPLRVAWAIHSGDWIALRRAVKLSHTLWGGRFNPIVFADKPDEARKLIDVFRADLIWPIGDSSEVKEFPDQFRYLIDPLMGELFFKHPREMARAQLLDIHNMLVHWRNKPEWKALEEKGIRFFSWDKDDPLADVFLMQLGEYPDANEIGVDYSDILNKATLALLESIDKAQPLPLTMYQHPSLGYLTRLGLYRHYSIRAGWDYPGFFVGDAADIIDLVDFWNLRAADIGLQFVDPKHIARYADTIPTHVQRVRADLLNRSEHERNIAVWAQADKVDDALKLFPGEKLTGCRIGSGIWNGLNIQPPMMILGEESSLGVFGRDGGKPRVSFALADKPFSSDGWFFTQHLALSLSLIGGLGSDDHHTFRVPYIPELNEFFSRSMHFEYDRLRAEPERIGLIIDATETDSFLNALSVDAIIEKVFDLASLRAKLSSGGLITRQLISRLGGVGNARVFKIPGVRRLLKTHGPTASFTKKAALGLIAGKDQDNPAALFSDHERLYIEPRKIGSKLTPQMVFGYLVANGLFRIGVELTCPTCQLTSWIALDALKQRVNCDLCGSEYDATRQLVDGTYHYRRTGVLGLERNTQGAIPVALVLEQLARHLGSYGIYARSYDLEPKRGSDLPVCEVDLVIIVPEKYPAKTSLIFGECKDSGGIDAVDVANLKRIADAIPQNRFETYIVLTKLVPFSREEIELAKTLNGPYQRRVIMLTARELEPYDIFEHKSKELGVRSHARSAKELAAVTHKIYFSSPDTAAQ